MTNIAKGRIVSMKILDKNVDSARKGEECGIVIGDYKNIAEGDLIRSYTVTKYKPEVKFDGG